MLREYIVSEAMAALGIPTTRALAAVTTGEHVRRETVLPGAVLARVASSHIRIGTFEYFAEREDTEALATLAEYALARHYPDAVGADRPAVALLERVVDAQAELIARWLGVGFIHGVMNTDNTSIAGETLDYGPCAFLDAYQPTKKFSAIDRGGRYAFQNQPRIALTRLAEALLPLLDDDAEAAVRLATERLGRFSARFEAAHARVLRDKLGLTREDPEDVALAGDLLSRLAANDVDYTVFFRRLCDAASDPAADAYVSPLFAERSVFHDWAERWRARLATESVTPAERASAMRRANPAFIPRNHRVEEAIAAALDGPDYAPFEALVETLARPYEDQPERAHLAAPPAAGEEVLETFCGT